MKYEIGPNPDFPNEWRVQVMDAKTGEIFFAVFNTADAEARANEYARWKQEQQLGEAA